MASAVYNAPMSIPGPIPPVVTFNASASAEAAADPAQIEKEKRIARFLDDAAVPEVLKHTYRVLIPEGRFDTIADMIAAGEYDDAIQCPAAPLGGLLAQLAAVPKTTFAPHMKRVMRALNDRAEIPLAQLTAPYIKLASGSTSFNLADYKGQAVASWNLVSLLIGRHELKLLDIAAIAPRLLAQNHTMDDTTIPRAHHYILFRDRKAADLDAIEKAAGTLDFLDIRDDRGRTVFFRLASDQASHSHALDLLSWMIQRKPELVHATDDLGWTALDRYVQRVGTVENAHQRFLIAAGATFNRQVPPGLSVADALAWRERHATAPARQIAKSHPKL